MGTEDALTPAVSALYSLSRVVASSSCVITHPISEAWALIREWGSCPWLSELDGRPYRAHLLDGTCNTAVGARRVVNIGEQRMFERLTAVDDDEHILKWRLISHPDTINPFLASLVNHESKIKLTHIALGNQTLIEWQGTFFTEPQHAPSMKTTFSKLHVQGFVSLQSILTASALARSRSNSEGSESGVPNGRVQGERGSSLGSTASGSLGSSRSGSHQSKSSSLGSLNGDRDKPSRYAQAYPKQGQPLNSMRNSRGTSLETIPSDRQLPMEDLAIRSNSEPEAGSPEPLEGEGTEPESASRPEPSPEASPDIVDAWAPPTSHAMGSSGGSFGSSAGSFTFNDQLLIPTSSLGPALNGFAKSASVPLSSAGGAMRSPTSPMYKMMDPSSEMLAVLRSKQQSPSIYLRQGELVRSGSLGKQCFTDDACELARLDRQDMQRVSDAFQRSQSLGTNGYLRHPPSVHPGSQASQFSKALGMRSSDLPPLSRTPRAGEPALDRGANMLMPQVYDSRGSSSSGGASEKSLGSMNRSGSGRVSLDHWVSR